MRSIATEYSPATQSGDTRPPMETAIRNGYRPRPATVEKSREIRESAGHFIAGQGLWRFNMQALARHLRLLLPTLCYYYKRREDVIADIALRHLDMLRIRIGQAMDEAADGGPAAALHAFAREYLLVALAEREFHRLMTLYPDLAEPSGARAFRERQAALRAIVETRLAAHAPPLRDRPDAVRSLSRTLVDALSGAAGWLEPYGPVKPVAYAAMVADWVLDQAARS